MILDDNVDLFVLEVFPHTACICRPRLREADDADGRIARKVASCQRGGLDCGT